MRLKWFVGAVLPLVASSVALAQTGMITGTVTSADGGQPVVSANVVVVGARAGAMTHDDGRYTIAVAPGTYTLRVTRIGFAPDTVGGVVVTAGATTTVDVRLNVAAVMLGEVVSIGYGTTQARDLTGSVATTTTKDFNTGRVVAPEELIRGKIPGVQVVDNNEPGGGIAVRIRGGTSVTASNDPLYVIDGVPLEVGGGATSGRNPLNFINPNDIESITVLKDASSTAIFGSRGANGVVMITTKSGSTGPQFTYTGTASTSRVTGGPDMLNATQFRAAVASHASYRSSMLGNANTDWLGAVEQNGTGYEHNLALGGRRQDMAYRMSVGYLSQSGVLQGTETNRTSLGLNYNDRLFNRLRVSANLKGARTKDLYTPGGVLGNAIAYPSTQPIYSSGNTYYEFRNASGGALTGVPNNPLAILSQIQDVGTTLRSVGDIEGEYEVPGITGLTATLRGGYDVNRADRATFTPTTLYSQLTASNPGNVYRNSPEQAKTVLDAFAKYGRQLPWFGTSFDITGGVSTERFRGDYNTISASGLSTNLLGLYGVPTANLYTPTIYLDETRLNSGFGRANFSILDRYLLTATVRRDGSSRFAKGNQYAVFPSAAFAWRVIDESWLKDRTPLSDLKFRVAWGKNGNQSVGNYLAYLDYTYGNATGQTLLGTQYVPTIRPEARDPNLHWETSTQTNIGIDYGFLGQRINGTIDYYTKKTTDLLFDVPTAAGTNLSNHVVTNIGAVQNRGLELSLNSTIIQGGKRGFNWDANFNASTNSNKLLSTGRSAKFILTGGIAGGVGNNVQILEPGIPVFSFYVYHQIGDTSGVPIYEDRNKDGIINEQDLRPFHSPAPKWILGHTSNFTWNGFDASATLRAYLGNYVYNNVASNLGYYNILGQGNAPTNLHASVLKTGFISPQYLSDVYVEDASFLRMDNLTLGYTFGSLPVFGGRLREIEGTRVFGTIQNVFTKTKYSGVDPTAGLNGIDNNIYPRSRTFLAGVTLGF